MQRHTPRAPVPTAARTACSSTRTAPCVLATSAKRQASAQRQARLAGGGADDAVVPTFCYKIEAVLGMRFCDPDQLIGKKRRNRLAAADNTICYLTRGTFKEDQHDAGFADTRWVELEELYENCGKAQLNGAVKKYRKAEDEAVKAAIAEFEEGIED